MKIAHVGAISTSVVIALGLAMIIPAFTQHDVDNRPTPVMVSFNVLDNSQINLDDWCKDLALLIEKHKVPAVVFLSGKIAEAHSECVSSFPHNVDIGSQTYSYVNLPSLADYSEALEEVKHGKIAVDKVGKLNSKIFRAPYGSTDDNIYSLLSRSNITADFSYKGQYNKYANGMFVRYDLATLSGANNSSRLLELSYKPIDIIFDTSDRIDHIDSVISRLKSEYGSKIKFVSPSGLTGLDLTIRGEECSNDCQRN